MVGIRAQVCAREVPLPGAMRGKVTISVDVEDWHQLVTRQLWGRLPECSPHVETQTERVLALLEARDVRATFFVLGLVAQARPALVRRIAGCGHEIASHGMEHVPFQRLDRARVRAELRDSRALLSDIVGHDVVGFRAPEFSIGNANSWVLDEVADAGYRYDSSIFPIRHRRYGVHDFARGPAVLSLARHELWELPMGTFPLPLGAGNVPVAGGGYFRLFPGRVLSRAFSALDARGDHAMLYFHPYEFTRQRLEVADEFYPRGLGDRLRAHVSLGLSAIARERLPQRLAHLLRSFQTVRAVDLVDALEADRGIGLNSLSSARADPPC